MQEPQGLARTSLPQETPAIAAGERRLAIADELFRFAYRIKHHRLSELHPEWDEPTLRRETLALIEKGCR